MGVVAPWFLAGVAAVGLPLWIHLLRRYRSEPQQFSSLMFFEPRTQSSVRHRRLRYLLLLALRLALLVLLALAFANPFVTVPPVSASGNRLLILVIDRSFSMRYGDHFAKAKQRALEVLAGWPSGQQAEVVALDSDAAFLTRPSNDQAQLRSAITAIEPGDQASSYAALARALRGVVESERRPLEVHLFSDFHKTAMPAAFADLQLPRNTTLIRESVASKDEPNWTVESVNAPARLFDAKKHRVTATVAGFGTPAGRRTVSLVLDGRVLESKLLDVPESGRASVEFQSLESPYGLHRGEVRIDAADRLPQDDRFPFAVERAEPRPVLFLYPANRTRAVFYYRNAMESSGFSGFTVQSMPVEQAGSAKLSSYAFVVLADLSSLPSSLEAELHSYVNGGGGLLVTLGPGSGLLSHVPVSGQSIRGDMRPDSAEAATSEAGHSAMEGVDFGQVKFYQAVRVETGASPVMARLADKTPLAFESRIGAGKVLVFASSFDNSANDFPLHPSFVPFVEHTARFLAGGAAAQQSLPAGSFVELHVEGDNGTSVDLTGPDGKRALSLSESASAKTLRLEKTGFYEVHGANGMARLIAVHPPQGESDLARVPDETLDLWAKSSSPAAQASTAGVEPRSESLGIYILMFVLILALAESLFSVRYLWSGKETA